MKLGCMLINYNNGSGSRILDMSKGPAAPRKPEVDDCLTMLMDSYYATVATDCPFIIIDDGSTDNSMEIFSRYSDRVTRVIRKEKNMGLTANMNEAADILIDEYGCDAICRFDGDIEFLTQGWDLKMLQYFAFNPNAGAVGALQLTPFGSIWACGDMVIHPAGYCHILGPSPVRGRELANPVYMSRDLVMGNMECDSVMGCLAAFRTEAYRKVGGLKPEFNDLRGETEDLNLRLLLEGYRSYALGSIAFIHRHMEHQVKTSVYDTSNKVQKSFDIWKDLWGWDKLKPDLAAIYERWNGTLLTRNLLKTPGGEVQYIGP